MSDGDRPSDASGEVTPPHLEPASEEHRAGRVWWVVLGIAGLYLLVRQLTGGMGLAFVTYEDGRSVAAPATEYAVGVARVSYARSVGLWVAALMTLFVFSFLYGDNPAYKFAEAVLVGVSAAYYMVVGFWEVIVPTLLAPLFPAFIQSTFLPGNAPVREPDWYWTLIPLILGIMLLMRLAPKATWLSRWPLAFIVGSFAGLRLYTYLRADFLVQIRESIVPLVSLDSGTLQGFETLVNLLILTGVICCLVYFFFSIEHTGAVGGVARVGIWYLMITFGAMFGFTVMGRIVLLAARFEFLFADWLWWVDPTQSRVGL